ncbi:MAG: PQQ-binding-like beta-propeller repeat protein, partial [Gemmataceae bacterium]
MNTRRLLALAFSVLFLSPLAADDWPQFNGPERNGISKEKGLLATWPKGGPKLVWTYKEAGVGYSAPAVVGDRLYILGGRDKTEYLIALDVKAGKELWSAKIGDLFTWKGNSWNAGPSATPTVDGDLIFALGGQGVLLCTDTAGKEKWRKDLPKDMGAQVNPSGGGPKDVGWGYAWSPLVDGDKLIIQPGGPQGTLAALNKTTGEILWRSKGYTDQASYASPIVATVAGTRQYINLTNEGLTGVDPKTGAVLWRYAREYNDCVIPTPVVS